MCFFRKCVYFTCPSCGSKVNTPATVVRAIFQDAYCLDCKTKLKLRGFQETKQLSSYAAPSIQRWRKTRPSLVLLVILVAFATSGCEKATYDRGFKAGEKSGYSKGYATGHRRGETAGKTQGYAAGTATFVSGTLIPNLGLIIAITTLATATSWLSVHYLIPQHRANQAKYDAKNSIEKTRKQLKAKYQVTVRQEIKRLKTNLKLEKHEQSLQGKLEKLFADASLLLLEDSNRLVDELCNRQLKTIKEIASASDLTTEEKILLYPATANDVSKITKKEKSDV